MDRAGWIRRRPERGSFSLLVLSALPPGVSPGRTHSSLTYAPFPPAAMRTPPLCGFCFEAKTDKRSCGVQQDKPTPSPASRPFFAYGTEFSRRPSPGGWQPSIPSRDPIGDEVPGGTVEGSTPPTPHQHAGSLGGWTDPTGSTGLTTEEAGGTRTRTWGKDYTRGCHSGRILR